MLQLPPELSTQQGLDYLSQPIIFITHVFNKLAQQYLVAITNGRDSPAAAERASAGL